MQLWFMFTEAAMKKEAVESQGFYKLMIKNFKSDRSKP